MALGFDDFATCLASMKASGLVNELTSLDGESLYEAIPRSENIHLRMEQWRSAHDKVQKALRKLKRAEDAARTEGSDTFV